MIQISEKLQKECKEYKERKEELSKIITEMKEFFQNEELVNFGLESYSKSLTTLIDNMSSELKVLVIG